MTETGREVEQLRQWKREATEVILGLQDLGKALRLPLGLSITGRAAAEAAERWVARADSAEQECRDRECTEQDVRARLADAEAEVKRLKRDIAGQTRSAQSGWRAAGALRAELIEAGKSLARVRAVANEWDRKAPYEPCHPLWCAIRDALDGTS